MSDTDVTISSDQPPRLSRRKLAALSGAFIVVLITLTLADPAITKALFFPDGRDDWWRASVKFVGDLRFWLAIAIIAFAITRDWRFPAALLGSPALAGGFAELGKLLFGRERPVSDFVIQNDAHYVFKPLFQGFTDGSNLGFPSSHAATAFGGATMLAILMTGKARPLVVPAFLLAAGCAASRVFAGAHFATDVLVGAALGYLTAHTIALISDTMSRKKDSNHPVSP